MYIAIAGAIAIVLTALFIPFRRPPAAKSSRARWGAALMLAVPVGFAALAVFDRHSGEPFSRDLIMAAATALASICLAIRVRLQGKPSL